MEILQGLAKQWPSMLKVILVLSVTTFVLSKLKARSKNISTQDIAISAMLMAISIVLTRVASIMVPLGGYSALRLGFGPIPIMLASILLGPVLGAMVGAGADLLGMMMISHGAFSPYIFIAQTLYGVIPFFVIYLFKNKNTFVYGTAVVITQLICGTITAYGLSLILDRPFNDLLLMRAPAQIIIMVGYAVIVGLMHAQIFKIKRMATSR